MFDFGILWMNARNLSYIRKFNNKKAIRLADNKEKTKRFLHARWIPVPETYALIKTYDQLWSFNFRDIEADQFIIKPVRWSRGRWIYRVGCLWTIKQSTIMQFWPQTFDFSISKHSPYVDEYYKVGSSLVDDTTLRRYLLDILYWRNSLVWDKDQILIEELLVPWWGFEPFCEHGLADIRVIVFNLIPVAAMLRVPTPESDGKANLDRWALWMGIEVWSWKVYWMYVWWKIHQGHFPDKYKSFAHKTIPYWDEILLYSSKIQYFANLWYLALDWVITPDWPKLLEINARAWLKFQLAAQLPLKRRLEKIGDLKVVTPEKWVEIAQTLFSHHKTPPVASSKLLYLTQHGTLTSLYEAKEKVVTNVIVQVDINKRHSYVSVDLWPLVLQTRKTIVKTEQWVELSHIKRKKLEKQYKHRIILWREAVAEYYVKPINKIFTSLSFINPKKILQSEIDDIHILDQRVDKLAKQINISRILKPINFLEELDTFITRNGKYNPHFHYAWPTNKSLRLLTEQSDMLLEKYFGTSWLQSKFAQLFKEKIREIQKKVELIRAYKSQDFHRIIQANQALFWKLDNDLIQQAWACFIQHVDQDRTILWPVLKRERIFALIKTYMHERWLHDVKIIFDSNALWRMSIKRWRILTIRISEVAWFREQELIATLAHEVDVHIRRYQSWIATWWHILKNWTAWYIVDEEWLAVYKSLQHLPDEYEKVGMYQKYYLLSITQEKSFSDLVWIIRSLSNKSLMWSFKAALRLKKWITDTERDDWIVYSKTKIYLEWYTHICKRIEAWWDVEQLLSIWKIKTSDLSYIQ